MAQQSHSGIFTREIKTCWHKNLYIRVCNSFIDYTHKLKTPQLSFTRRMIKMQYFHTGEYASAIKTNKLLIHTRWMNLKGTMLSESQPQRLSDSTYMTFWERQNCRDGEEISGSEKWRESLTTKGQHEGSFWKLFCTWLWWRLKVSILHMIKPRTHIHTLL